MSEGHNPGIHRWTWMVGHRNVHWDCVIERDLGVKEAGYCVPVGSRTGSNQGRHCATLWTLAKPGKQWSRFSPSGTQTGQRLDSMRRCLADTWLADWQRNTLRASIRILEAYEIPIPANPGP